MGKNILASSSPRRADILKDKFKVEIVPSPYEEIHSTTVFSYEYVEDLAYNKAQAVIPLVDNDCVIIGADTVVVLDDKILGKPKDVDEAKSMLRALSNRTHKVVTSIAVINTSNLKHVIQSTTSVVEFENLTDEQIDFYVDSFKPLDKAGAYGIQELPVGYVKQYSGSLENIIGICPVALEEAMSKLLAF